MKDDSKEPLLIKIEVSSPKKKERCSHSCKKQCVQKPYTIFDPKPPRQKRKSKSVPTPDAIKKSGEVGQGSKNNNETHDSYGKLLKAPDSSSSESITSIKSFVGSSPTASVPPVPSIANESSENSVGENRNHRSRQESLTLQSTRILVKPVAEKSSSQEQLYENSTEEGIPKKDSEKSPHSQTVPLPVLQETSVDDSRPKDSSVEHIASDMPPIEKTTYRPVESAVRKSGVSSKEPDKEKPSRPIRVSIQVSKIPVKGPSIPKTPNVKTPALSAKPSFPDKTLEHNKRENKMSQGESSMAQKQSSLDEIFLREERLDEDEVPEESSKIAEKASSAVQPPPVKLCSCKSSAPRKSEKDAGERMPEPPPQTPLPWKSSAPRKSEKDAGERMPESPSQTPLPFKSSRPVTPKENEHNIPTDSKECVLKVLVLAKHDRNCNNWKYSDETFDWLRNYEIVSQHTVKTCQGAPPPERFTAPPLPANAPCNCEKSTHCKINSCPVCSRCPCHRVRTKPGYYPKSESEPLPPSEPLSLTSLSEPESYVESIGSRSETFDYIPDFKNMEILEPEEEKKKPFFSFGKSKNKKVSEAKRGQQYMKVEGTRKV